MLYVHGSNGVITSCGTMTDAVALSEYYTARGVFSIISLRPDLTLLAIARRALA